MPYLPQARLIERLKALDDVVEIVGEKIFPELVPAPPNYPAVVFQVLSNKPYNDANGGSNSFLMELRVACLAIAKGPSGPYTRTWKLANAVCGDAEAADIDGNPAPTGLSGWRDSAKSIWHLIDEFDEAGEIREGTETYWAYVVNQIYRVQYVRF